MVNRLAHELGLMSSKEMERVKNLLLKHNLPVEYHIEDVDTFYDKFFLDKKSANNKIKFILPKGIGAFEVRDDIDEHIVKRVLR
jgi:3-dehydroquinate synthase